MTKFANLAFLARKTKEISLYSNEKRARANLYILRGHHGLWTCLCVFVNIQLARRSLRSKEVFCC